MRRTSRFSEPSAGGLAQTMRRALREPSLVAPLAEAIAEPGAIGVGGAGLSRQEGEITAFGGGDNPRQLGVHRDHQFSSVPLGLLRAHVNHAVAMRSHLYHITAALRGIEKQGHCQPRL